jgi:hypothetical protein
MNKIIECPNCFHRVRVDAERSSAALKCLRCGHLLDTSEEEQAPAYGLGVRVCPKCNKDSAADAVVCLDCGYNFETRKQHRTKFQPYQATWKETMPLTVRLLLFIVLTGLCVGLLLIRRPHGFISFGITIPALWLSLGTFRRVTLSRNPDGKAQLKVARWIGFVPWGRKTFNLKRYKFVQLEYKGSTDDSETIGVPVWGYADCDDFFMIFGVWFDYEVYTLKIHAGGIEDPELICCTTSESKSRDIADAICKVGGLRYG